MDNTVDSRLRDMSPPVPQKRSTVLRELIFGPDLAFLMEAHNGLSAKVVQDVGFKGIWASGLTISASLGVRDSNEASWTQILDVLEFMTDASHLPILMDGDTGYGNFNSVRRLVRKLCDRGIAGVCLEDKLFPKTNSFIGERQPLADVDEFCGRIAAGKDSQTDDDFVVVARVEALIAGRGMTEALKRAEAYHEAGADAILIHSKQSNALEILAFADAWAGRAPLVIVPTMYYATPTEIFEKAGISTVIWANHLLRSAVTAMYDTAETIFKERSLVRIEDKVASVEDVFDLVGNAELQAAEKRYLPQRRLPTAIVLAASQGELGSDAVPRCMADIRGRPLLDRLAGTLARSGVRDITVVRGFAKQAVNLPGLGYVDNDDFATTEELYSLNTARNHLKGECVIVYGDTLFRHFILDTLLQTPGDIVIAVDRTTTAKRPGRSRSHDFVVADRASVVDLFDETPAHLSRVGNDIPASEATGEWIGLMRLSARGCELIVEELDLANNEGRLETENLPAILSRICKRHSVLVQYFDEHWIDVDNLSDLADARNFC